MLFSHHHHLLFLFFFLTLSAGKSNAGYRRILHQPFFPLNSGNPTPAPSQSPPSPRIPKLPFTSEPSPPFFPVDPANPSPPSTPANPTVTTLPANISGLLKPQEKKSGGASSKIIIAAVLALFALGLVSLFGYFFIKRVRDPSSGFSVKGSAGSGSLRLFSASSVANKVGVSNSSDVLYLGTLVDSRRIDDSSGAGNSPYRKLSSPENFQHRRSPELLPLPPLSRQEFRSGNVDSEEEEEKEEEEEEEEEEFYSPRGSEESPAGSSRKISPPVILPASRGSSNLSTPSYPSSHSSSEHASPSNSPSPIRFVSEQSAKIKSPILESYNVAGIPKFRPPPPPPPPPRPRTRSPSPPKRKPPSPSPSSSPSKTSGSIAQSSPARVSDFSAPLKLKQGSNPPPPPPPPPPLPRANFWETKLAPISRPPFSISRPPFSEHQALVTPSKIVELKTPVVSTFELSENADSVERNEETPKPKLKPLHWDKVRASSDRATVWDQLKCSSFQLNEEMIETLFVCNDGNSAQKEGSRRQVLPSPNQENRVLDPKKSQNIAILLRALNVTKEEVCEALLEGKTDALGSDLLETLVKMAPTKEEELRLREFKDDSPSKLGPAERFLKAVLDIPFAFKRVDAMLYIANFESEMKYLRKSFQTLEAACEELRTSRLFLKLLEAVLKTGNRMNVGTNRGDAQAFKLDTLLKLVDIKGTDSKTTLLHFVVQEIIRTEGSRISSSQSSGKANATSDEDIKKLGLQVVAGLGNELSNVKKAATMDSDVLNNYVSKLAGGIGKITEIQRLNDGSSGSLESGRKFFQAMNGFLRKAEEEIIRIQAEESVTLSLVKEITEYFHGNTAKEEAHPFRIFMVVRDFLSVLDQVCKEVGKMQERSTNITGSVPQFLVPVHPVLPPVFPRFHSQLQDSSSSDDDSSFS